MAKIGLLFGSFNPIHLGHLIVANFMVENLGLEKVWFVISPQNPFKKSKNLINEVVRYDMVKLATADNDKFEAVDLEFDMPKPNYTIDTLKVMVEKFSNHNFVVIIGEDNLHDFKKWKNYSQILDNFGLYVYPRETGTKNETLVLKNTIITQAPNIGISSSYIRLCIKTKKSIQYLVSKAVAELISSKKLYE